MKYDFPLAMLTTMVLSSCNDYQQQQVSERYIQTINAELSAAQENGAGWTTSPIRIAEHFFPSHAHDGGPTLYGITQERKTANKIIVSVKEEGAIDDEITGEQNTIIMRLHNKKWNIDDVRLTIRRRF